MPRTPAGQLILPRIVDESIGMYYLRELTGRDQPVDRAAEAASQQSAAVGGIPMATAAGWSDSRAGTDLRVAPAERREPAAEPPAAPIIATRAVVSARERPADTQTVADLAARMAARREAIEQARVGATRGRRLAAAGWLAAAILVSAVVLGVAFFPHGGEGSVLSAVGTPQATAGGVGQLVPSPSAEDGSTSAGAAASGTPIEATSSTAASAGSDGGTPGATQAATGTAVATPAPAPRSTPRPTPRPTATPRRTPAPTPSSTPAPTATPTVTPVPTPTPAPTPTPTPVPTPTPTPTPTPLPLPSLLPSLPDVPGSLLPRP